MQRLTVVCLVGFLIRCFVWAFYGQTSGIGFHQPIQSFKRVTEALHLHSLGASPYAAHTFIQPPLLLVPFGAPLQLIEGAHPSADGVFMLWSRFLFAASDILTAIGLAKFSRSHGQLKRYTSAPDSAAAALYLFNPITVLSCNAMALDCLYRPALIFGLHFAVQGSIVAASLLLAINIYVDLPSVALYLPMTLCLVDSRPNSTGLWTALAHAFLTLAFLGQLWYVSHAMLGYSWTALLQVYTAQHSFADYTPNWGFYWYLFQHMFNDLRSFWVWVFNFHSCAYALPLLVQFYALPSAGIYLYLLYLAVGVVLAPYPTLADIAFYVTLALIGFPQYVTGARFGFFLLYTGFVVLFLGPVFYLSWTVSGTGNANFFFFVTLVFNLCQVLFVKELVLQGVQDLRKYEKEVKALHAKKED